MRLNAAFFVFRISTIKNKPMFHIVDIVLFLGLSLIYDDYVEKIRTIPLNTFHGVFFCTRRNAE